MQQKLVDDRTLTTPGSLAQQVAARLEMQVLDEHIRSGERLGLRTELIDRFGVSGPIINEALRILRERGLIEVRSGPNGGVFVGNRPPQVRLGGIDVWYRGVSVEPEQLFEARRYLDHLFASVAVERATPEDVREMEWALDEMRAAQDDPRPWLEATMRLHLAIARASRIQVLIGMYETIVTALRVGISKARFVDGMEERRRRNIGLHAEIVAAIRERHASSLSELMALHDADMTRIM